MARLDPILTKENPALFWLAGFDGLNQRDSRRAIGDQECYWLENFIPLGKGDARAMYDATLTYTAPKTIVYQVGFNIGASFYQALFYSDGSAAAVNIDTGVATALASAGTFAVTPSLPQGQQWGSSGLVIVTADTNGYFAWDGTLFSPGSAAPTWLSGLDAALTPTGTTTSGSATITAVSSTTGILNGMWITGAGIPTNTYVVSTTATTIVMSQNATASATITVTLNWQMPLGIKGTGVEVYQNRAWVINGAVLSWTAPSNGSDFSTSNGGGSATSTDGFLRKAYVGIRQSNGYLYLFGDGSVNVISNVQTTGSPATTTFNNQNVDPQNGLGWRDALCPFGRALCYANPTGVYALFGGTAQKISDKIDQFFATADYITVTPTMFVDSIFGVRVLGIVINAQDPTQGINRTMMALWNGEKWFVGTQQYTPKYTSSIEEGGLPLAFGNDGTNLFKLFATASNTLVKKVASKLWEGRSQLIKKTSHDVYVETADYAGTGVVLSGTLDSDINPSAAFSITSILQFVNNSGADLNFVNNLSQALVFVSSPSGIQGAAANQYGQRLGQTLQSTSPDFSLVGMGQSYDENSFYGR